MPANQQLFKFAGYGFGSGEKCHLFKNNYICLSSILFLFPKKHTFSY